MARNNRQAPEFNPTAPLSPVARPFDTFTPAPVNSMQQLAASLSSLEPSLNRWVDEQKQEIDAKDFEAGKTAYMKAKDNLKNAVNKGVISAGFSPAFRRGYEQGELRVKGLEFDTQLREAYAQSAAANSDDPHAFQSFVSDFTSDYLQKNNIQGNYRALDVGEAFTPAVDAAQRSLAHYHTEQRAKTIEDNWQANAQNEISTIIDNAHANSYTPEQTAAAVTTAINKQMSNGWHDRSDFNKNIVNLVAEKAISTGNTGLLTILKGIPTGPGSTLGNTTYARSKMLEAEQHIQNKARDDQRWEWAQQSQQWSQEQHAWARQEHARSMENWAIERNAGSLMRAMVARAIVDPTQDFTKDMLTLNNADRDGSHARTFESFRQSILDAKTNGVDHPDAVTSLYKDMINSPQAFSPKKIVDAYSNGLISRRTLTGMLDDQRRVAESGAHPILHDSVYKTIETGVRLAFQGDPNEFDVTKVNKTTNALKDFQLHALRYISAHKDNLDQEAFYTEMTKYADRLKKPLLEQEKTAPKKPSAGGTNSNPYAQPGMVHH